MSLSPTVRWLLTAAVAGLSAAQVMIPGMPDVANAIIGIALVVFASLGIVPPQKPDGGAPEGR